jgi:hypothetical protein
MKLHLLIGQQATRKLSVSYSGVLGAGYQVLVLENLLNLKRAMQILVQNELKKNTPNGW